MPDRSPVFSKPIPAGPVENELCYWAPTDIIIVESARYSEIRTCALLEVLYLRSDILSLSSLPGSEQKCIFWCHEVAEAAGQGSN